jgi:putative oxidoreductase
MASLFTTHKVNDSASTALLCLRLAAGAAFMLHGWMKIQTPFNWMGPDSPIPPVFQFLAAFSEFFGGLAWVLGLLTHLASLGIFATMSVAVLFHITKGDPFVGRAGSYELALIYFCIAPIFIFIGPGRFSLDALISKNKDNS